jgi:hypothetical protein
MPVHNSEYVVQEDLQKAARKVGENKKHESKWCIVHLRTCANVPDFKLAKMEYAM